MYNREYTPEIITELKENEVLVFGTDPEGKHKSTAAQLAVKRFGAVIGKGEGPMGQSYAIPVHKHRRRMMVEAVFTFINYAKENPDKFFYVLAIGCGAAGMDPAFVALMLRKAVAVENIFLPKLFVEELARYHEIGVEISDDCMTVIRYPMGRQGKYILPYGVECLGEESFMGCSCDLELPQTLKRIEKWAFSDMGPFDYYVRIPSSVTFIDRKAFECEWMSPGMLVDYKSYAYNYAKEHKLRYKCIDFDEETYLKEIKEKEEKENRSVHCLQHLTKIKRGILNRYIKQVIPKGNVAIARDFAMVLNDDSHLTLLGHNENFKQLANGEKIVKITAAFAGYMGLTGRGQIVTCGQAHEFERSYEIERLQNVRDIVACEGHTVALFNDGTVESIDEPGGWEGVPNHSRIVKEWQHIKQIAAGFANIMGLTEDGKVLYHSDDGYTDSHFYDKYSDVVQIDCYSHYYGTDSSMVLHKNGTVSSDTFKGVETWRNIVQISVGADVAIGLKSDGTIEMVDNRRTRYEAKNWKNLVSIECKFFGVVGITQDGHILSLFS